MRFIRTLTAVLALVAVYPRSGAAQMGRPFTNAWFWGVKGGGMDYNSFTQTHQQAPLVGAEWLITRSRAGLYVSFSQAMFTDQSAVLVDPDTVPVTLKNMRRVDVAAVVFPGSSRFVHPYGGIGFSLKQIASAETSDPTFASDPNIQAFLTELRTGASPFFILGSQFRLPMFSVFFQGTASPAQKNMFLYNGKAFHLTYEGGVRFNVGGSIDRSN
ncbi:MAG TPA: hypothetical protein VJU87_00640 [Gemmatimonadaceae bacterium]|nr:hypothetical protein [Gemmatimonadaceae bacterium]